jgi:tetratricopeptide (TPR) repeat protein
MLLARAIQALGNREDPRACDAYSALVARDSLSAIGWLGLGDCRAIDSVVLRDARSPSGFSFRGSFSRAMSAYERATRLAPGAHAALPLSFVEKVLLTSSDRYRHGVAANPAQATTLFAARPSASGDTVAYVPRPIVGNALPPDPPNFEEGLQRNRALLLDYVTAWVQRAPSSVDAFEALASAQESRGELMRTSPNGELSALAALDSARRLPANAEARARIVAAQVRVLLKSGEFARARALTDSVLANASNASAREAHWFAGIAALTGRARDAARLARLGQTPPVDWGDTLAPPLADAATTLLLHAAYGLCGPEFAAAFDRLDDLIESYAAPAYRSATRDELTRRTRLLSVPCLGAKVIAGAAASAWERMAQSQARGDKGATRAAFDTLLTARRYRRPGATALDYTFFEATLLAAIGDTTAALRHLDRSLNALPTLNRNAVWELAQSATVGRAMAWRADLANRRGDAQTAKRWATAVLELWKNGDADLRPVLSRMREIAGS